jgi:hypothetical protein
MECDIRLSTLEPVACNAGAPSDDTSVSSIRTTNSMYVPSIIHTGLRVTTTRANRSYKYVEIDLPCVLPITTRHYHTLCTLNCGIRRIRKRHHQFSLSNLARSLVHGPPLTTKNLSFVRTIDEGFRSRWQCKLSYPFPATSTDRRSFYQHRISPIPTSTSIPVAATQ